MSRTCRNIKYEIIEIHFEYLLYSWKKYYYTYILSEEEIDTVTKELQKHDIQMPAFQKIGGLLTNSITTDTATLHDAVIAINQAVIDNVCLFHFV